MTAGGWAGSLGAGGGQGLGWVGGLPDSGRSGQSWRWQNLDDGEKLGEGLPGGLVCSSPHLDSSGVITVVIIIITIIASTYSVLLLYFYQCI